MVIRRFKNKDANAVSALIGRNFLEVNSKDYSLDEMIKKSIGAFEKLAKEIRNTIKLFWR